MTALPETHPASRSESTPGEQTRALAERTRLLAEGVRLGAPAGVIAAVVLVAISRDVADPAVLTVWLAAAILVHVAAIAVAFRPDPDVRSQTRLQRRHHALSVAIVSGGAIWGVAGWSFLPLQDPWHTAQFAILFAWIWAGAVATMGIAVPTLALFLTSSAVPVVVQLVVKGSTHDGRWLALTLAALAVLTVLGAIRMRRGYDTLIRLQLEAEDREESLRDHQARLAESEEKYRLLFECSEDPMWLIVGERFALANRAAAHFLEYEDVDALVDVHPSELSPERQPDGRRSDELAAERMQLAYQKGYHRFEWVHRTHSDREIPVEVTLTRVPYQGDVALFCTWRDVSDRHRAARELEHARELAEQASVAKSAFLATMSHEIRTPLSAVLGMTELLEDTSLDAEQREFTRTITTAGQNLLTVVNDILDLSKIEAGRMEISPRPCDVGRMLSDLDRLFHRRAAERGLEFSVELRPDCPRHAVFDDTRLVQILVNLCGNAFKFTEQGSIEVVASGAHGDDGEAWLRIAVRDTGIGIEASVQSTLFTPFTQASSDTTRRFGGTGLGLSISRRLARLMGGDVHVESEIGVGSTFTVAIPVQPATAPPSPGVESDDHVSGDGRPAPRVLVVDDVEVNRRVATAMLRTLGAQTSIACDGEQAVTAWREGNFDLILMDCQMPVLDGLAATRRIREEERTVGGHVAIVALTAAALAEDRQRCLAAGMDDFLSKPFRKTDLGHLLDRFAGAGAADPHPADLVPLP